MCLHSSAREGCSWSKKACNRPERGRETCRPERASGPRSLGECCAQQIVRAGKEDGRAGKEEQRARRENDPFLHKEGKRIMDGERPNSPFLPSGSHGTEDPKN